MLDKQASFDKYKTVFRRLKRAPLRGGGKAPHKPVLLLSVLMAYQNGLINDNKIFISLELVTLFKTNWNALVKTNNVCSFPLPFFHLSTDKVWKLIPKVGYEFVVESRLPLNSFSSLNEAVEYAEIPFDLCLLMKDEFCNLALQEFLLGEYFEKRNASEIFKQSYEGKLQSLESSILNEDPETYRSEIDHLINEKQEEEIFLRGAMFKREVPRLYNNKCCISMLGIDEMVGISMIDACHIIPFSKSHNDTITNGISLCPNLHRAFDRGLITINEDYHVVVSQKFKESSSNYSIRQFEGVQISLPENRDYWPLTSNLTWHAQNVFQ